MTSKKYQETSTDSTLHWSEPVPLSGKPRSGKSTSRRKRSSTSHDSTHNDRSRSQSIKQWFPPILVTPVVVHATGIHLKDSTGQRSDFCKASLRDNHLRHHAGK